MFFFSFLHSHFYFHKADVDKAVKAARAAFEVCFFVNLLKILCLLTFLLQGAWSKVSGAERGRLLYRLADLMEQHADELIAIEVM